MINLNISPKWAGKIFQAIGSVGKSSFFKWSVGQKDTEKYLFLIKTLLFVSFLSAVFLSSSTFVENCKALLPYYLRNTMPDPGVHLLFSAFIEFIKVFNPNHHAIPLDVVIWETTILAIFSLLMLAPRLTALAACGGQLALFSTWMMFQEISYFGHATESWTVLLFASFLIHVIKWNGSVRDIFISLSFGLVLGFLPTMRQSAVLIVVIPSATILIISGVMAVINLYLGQKFQVGWHFLKHLPPVLILLVSTILINFGIGRWWESHYRAPFNAHGSGVPLYLSLGFSNNPYNIAWDDDCTMVHGLLIDKTPWTTSPQHQRRLKEIWLERVKEDPGLVWKGCFSKTMYLFRYFSNRIDPRSIEKDGGPVKPSWALVFLMVIFLITFGTSLWFAYRFRNDAMLIYLTGTAGLLGSTLMPLVFIVPFYFGGFLAAALSFPLVVFPTIFTLPFMGSPAATEFERRRNSFVYKAIFLLGFTLILPAGFYTVFRTIVNQKEARLLLTENPLLQLKAQGFRYAHLFNRLSIEDQTIIINRLLSLHDQNLFRTIPVKIEGQNIFQPIVAAAVNRNLFIVGKMSNNWRMDLPSRVQGPRNSALLVLKDSDQSPGVLKLGDYTDLVCKISDENWDGRFRMFSLPQLEGRDWRAKLLNVGAYNFVDGSHVSGLVLRPISKDLLYRMD